MHISILPVSFRWIRLQFVRRAAAYAIVILILGSAAFGAIRFVNSGSAFPKVPAGFVGILLRKDGRALPHGQVVAPRVAPGELPYQGEQQDVLLPGWYPTDYQPWKWEWRYLPQTVVPPNHVVVVTRCFGEDLPENQVFADENPDDERRGILRRGPLRKTLEPGSHPLNLYAYDVRIFPVRSVEAGQVGVLCKRYGSMPKDPKAFLSETGERGVQKQGLTSGTYLINPLADEESSRAEAEALRLQADTRMKVSEIQFEAAKLRSEAKTLLGKASNSVMQTLNQYYTDGLRKRAAAFGDPSTYALWRFAESLNNDLKIEVRDSGADGNGATALLSALQALTTKMPAK